MNVLFLDFGGVLNHGIFQEIDPECIKNLNSLVSWGKAKVVLSTAWRCECSVQELRDLLHGWGAEVDVIGATPEVNFIDPEFDPEALLPDARIVEIRAWLDAHPEVDKFVVLDDNDIRQDVNFDIKSDPEIERCFVQTDPRQALSLDAAARALMVLES